MGVGIYNPGGGQNFEPFFRAKPTTILLLDPDVAFAKDVRRWFPKAFIVGRRYLQSQTLENPQVRVNK